MKLNFPAAIFSIRSSDPTISAPAFFAFANANQGSSDILLMQMAIQYGYKLALENLEIELS